VAVPVSTPSSSNPWFSPQPASGPGQVSKFPEGPEPAADPIAPHLAETPEARQTLFRVSHTTQMASLDAPVPPTCAGFSRFSNASHLAQWLPPAWSGGDVVLRYGWVTVLNATAFNFATLDSDGSFANNQVAGVDEADFMKTDGRMLYTRQGSSLVVAQIYPPESARILERLPVSGTIRALLIDPAHLAVISAEANSVVIRTYGRTASPLVLEREISLNGTYAGARAIGDHLFVVLNFALFSNYGRVAYVEDSDNLGGSDSNITLRVLTVDGQARALKASDIGYLDSSKNATNLLTLIKLNLSSPAAPTLTTLLADAGATMYVSASNLYLAGRAAHRLSSSAGEVTAIHKLPLRRGAVECAASSEVPGRVLNQFALDEYGGNLRVATTLGRVENLVSVLSEDLSLLGTLEDLAPGERIYSARFMGERLYLVTFKKVDPLFVINLSDPAHPAVLGYLKIPGFSDYLHPVADGFLVGVGKDTAAAQTGDFAWFQGVKLSLFDVRDFEHPSEVAQLVIGDRGSWTPVSTDHLAFTWIAERSMLVLPVHVFEINWSRAGASASASTYGQEVWQGAYVIKVSVEAGFEVVHKIAYEGEPVRASCSWWSWGGSTQGFTRSFVVEPYVYTAAQDRVEAHSLDNGTRAMDMRFGEVADAIAPTTVRCLGD